MNLKYLILLIYFGQVLYYCTAADCIFNPVTTGFVVFARENPDGIIISKGNLTIFDAFKKPRISRSVIFLVHGFLSTPNDTNLYNLAQALLKKDDFLIMSLDWKTGACYGGPPLLEYLFYPVAVKNSRLVGKYLAQFTKQLVARYKVPMSNIRIFGHSLGAHVSGFAGKEAQKLHLGKYSEIIGLDPAGPLFKSNKCSDRICETDAKYVQILHTSNVKGTMVTLGTVDFYINSGRRQPGCELDETCSHGRAVDYLTECVKRECCLIGTPWTNYRQKASEFDVTPLSQCTKETCVCVGLNAKKYPSKGSFYVPVEANPPYCYNEGVKLEL
ncbi:hypothetical protein M0802_010036 [Mischocyttarus mexicanus]|nr:hypothetical protein M0802_010036 [Mischocyttarus mexicanus]